MASTIRADGFSTQPHFARAGATIPADYLKFAPPGSAAVPTDKGYYDEAAFVDYIKWMVKVTAPFRSPHLWDVFYFDGYGPHVMSYDALQILRENRFIAMCLPSHTSHVLQPDDVSIFGPFKRYFKEGVDEVRRLHPNQQTTYNEVPMIVAYAWAPAHSAKNVRAGFKKCGLWPFQPDWYDQPENQKYFTAKRECAATLNTLKVTSAMGPLMDSPFESDRLGCLDHVSRLAHSGMRGMDEDEFAKSLKRRSDALGLTVSDDVLKKRRKLNSKRYVETLGEVTSHSQKEKISGRRRAKRNALGEDPAFAREVNDEDRLERMRQLREDSEEFDRAKKQRAKERDDKRKAREEENRIKQAAKARTLSAERDMWNLLSMLGFVSGEQKELTKKEVQAFYKANSQYLVQDGKAVRTSSKKDVFIAEVMARIMLRGIGEEWVSHVRA